MVSPALKTAPRDRVEEYARLRRLAQLLITKTRERKLNWRQTADEQMFLAGYGGGRTVEVGRRSHAHFLVLRDDDGGRVIDVEEFLPQAFEASPDAAGPRGDFAVDLEELYDLARWHACDVGEGAREAIEALERL